MAQSNVKVDLSGFRALRAAVEGGLSVNGAGPLGDWIGKKVPARYSAFVRRRYDQFSKGGGNWQPLADSTIAQRRTGKGTRTSRTGQKVSKTRGTEYTRLSGQLRTQIRQRKDVSKTLAKMQALVQGPASILRDTGTLFNALQVNAANNLTQRIPNGVIFGFKPAPHPSEGGASIQDIAHYHNAGQGVPKRVILAVADAGTVAAMNLDLKNAMQQTLAQSSLKGTANG